MTLHTTFLPPGLPDLLEGQPPGNEAPYCADVTKGLDADEIEPRLAFNASTRG
ncbi:hypothetical protein [Myxococcus xanthus]|uniref:hypothetical protein n=1 Tax=Myxococcus xanthus TaxID=34 RepID=UPI0013761D97|nr:hypothetical protein [Myxococcus xanthus]